MRILAKILFSVTISLAIILSSVSVSEAKYMGIVFKQDAKGFTFNTASNREWLKNHIQSKLKEHGEYWTIEWKDANSLTGWQYTDELARAAANWDPNAYGLVVIIDECFINHTDFSHWRTGHVDLKDPFVGVNLWLYRGDGEPVHLAGCSKHLTNRQESDEKLFNYLFRKCSVQNWDDFIMKTLFPVQEKPKGNYFEDYM